MKKRCTNSECRRMFTISSYAVTCPYCGKEYPRLHGSRPVVIRINATGAKRLRALLYLFHGKKITREEIAQYRNMTVFEIPCASREEAGKMYNEMRRKGIHAEIRSSVR